MTPLTLTIMLLLGMLFLMCIGMPVAFSLALPALVVIYLGLGSQGFILLANFAWGRGTSFLLIAIPLFIFMASLFHEGGLAEELFESASKVTSGVRGGLAAGCCLACGIFSAITGSSAACAATMSQIALPSLKKRGYSPALASGALATAGALGCLIPPSITFIILGDMTGTSVGKLFMAGFGPGIVNMSLLMLTALLWGWLRPQSAPATPGLSLLQRVLGLRYIWSALVIIFVVMGGIYTGIMTPTESAGVGAVAALLLVVFRQRRLPLRVLGRAAVTGIRTTSWIMLLLIGGYTFGFALTYLRLPLMVTEFIAGMEVNRWVILILMNLLLIVMGCLMDSLTMILITVPIMFPVAVNLGFDPIWFNVLITINTEIAAVTPPVGLNLFVLQGISKLPFATVARGAVPFIIALVVGFIILCLFPPLATWLPSTM